MKGPFRHLLLAGEEHVENNDSSPGTSTHRTLWLPVCNLGEAQEQQLVPRHQLQVVGDSDLPDRESRYPGRCVARAVTRPAFAKTAAGNSSNRLLKRFSRRYSRASPVSPVQIMSTNQAEVIDSKRTTRGLLSIGSWVKVPPGSPMNSRA